MGTVLGCHDGDVGSRRDSAAGAGIGSGRGVEGVVCAVKGPPTTDGLPICVSLYPAVTD